MTPEKLMRLHAEESSEQLLIELRKCIGQDSPHSRELFQRIIALLMDVKTSLTVTPSSTVSDKAGFY